MNGTAPGREKSVSLNRPFSSVDCLWVGPDRRGFDLRPTPFCSMKAVYRFSTPSPLPPGITLDDRLPRGGGNAAAHIAGQEFAIRACVRVRVYSSVPVCRTSSRVVTELSSSLSGRSPYPNVGVTVKRPVIGSDEPSVTSSKAHVGCIVHLLVELDK